MNSIDLIETYAYGTRKDLVSKKEDIKKKKNKIIKLINFDNVRK